MSLDDVDILRTIADKDIVHIKRALDTRSMELIFRQNKVTNKIPACGTPISWSKG